MGHQKGKFPARAVAVFPCLLPDTGGVDHDIPQLQKACIGVYIIHLVLFNCGKIRLRLKGNSREGQYVRSPVDPSVVQIHAVHFLFVRDHQIDTSVIGTFLRSEHSLTYLLSHLFRVKIKTDPVRTLGEDFCFQPVNRCLAAFRGCSRICSEIVIHHITLHAGHPAGDCAREIRKGSFSRHTGVCLTPAQTAV